MNGPTLRSAVTTESVEGVGEITDGPVCLLNLLPRRQPISRYPFIYKAPASSLAQDLVRRSIELGERGFSCHLRHVLPSLAAAKEQLVNFVPLGIRRRGR
jgi:hypothetical protein